MDSLQYLGPFSSAGAVRPANTYISTKLLLLPPFFFNQIIKEALFVIAKNWTHSTIRHLTKRQKKKMCYLDYLKTFLRLYFYYFKFCLPLLHSVRSLVITALHHFIMTTYLENISKGLGIAYRHSRRISRMHTLCQLRC